MGNNNGRNDTGLMDAAGGLALIPFFLAAGMIFVIGVAIAFIWVPILLLIVWAIARGLWEIGLPQFLWGLLVDGFRAAGRAIYRFVVQGWDRCRGKTVVALSPAELAREARLAASRRRDFADHEQMQREVAAQLEAEHPGYYF